TLRPQLSSARNTWPARITGLTLLADRVRLNLDGQPSALVDVTPAAVAELSLDPGTQVWLTVKATDLEVYAPAEKQPVPHGQRSCPGGSQRGTVNGRPRAAGLPDVLRAVRLAAGGHGTEKAQLVQPPDAPHGPGVRSGQLGDLHPEAAEVASP